MRSKRKDDFMSERIELRDGYALEKLETRGGEWCLTKGGYVLMRGGNWDFKTYKAFATAMHAVPENTDPDFNITPKPIHPLVDAAENVVIARSMDWDMEGVLDVLCAAVIKQRESDAEIKNKAVKAMVERLLKEAIEWDGNEDNPSHDFNAEKAEEIITTGLQKIVAEFSK